MIVKFSIVAVRGNEFYVDKIVTRYLQIKWKKQYDAAQRAANKKADKEGRAHEKLPLPKEDSKYWYLIKWLGYPENESSLITLKQFVNCKKALKKLKEKLGDEWYLASAGELAELMSRRKPYVGKVSWFHLQFTFPF